MVLDVNVLTNGWTVAGVIISGFVAVGTISLAIVALITIQKTNKEYRNRQLDEIIEWAEDIRTCNIDKDADARLREAKNPWIIIWLELGGLVTCFENIKRKGRNIRRLALTFRQEPLNNAIDELLADLQTHMELIGLQQIAIDLKAETFPPQFDSAEEKVVNHLKLLYLSADKIIDETSKIKIKN